MKNYFRTMLFLLVLFGIPTLTIPFSQLCGYMECRVHSH
jgi:urea transporter